MNKNLSTNRKKSKEHDMQQELQREEYMVYESADRRTARLALQPAFLQCDLPE